jgi:hypothetical protein
MAAMTFLQLVNRARQEAGLANGDLSTLVSGLSAESARFKNWVADAWTQVQTENPDYQFMRKANTFQTVAGQFLYTPQQARATVDGTSSGAVDLGNWKKDSFRIYTVGSNFTDEMLTSWMTWDVFRNVYQYGSMRTSQSRSVSITIDPTKNLGLGMTPDLSTYVVVYEYYRKPSDLVADTDTPDMPDRFHMLIVWRALLAYGVFMSAPEVIDRAQAEISRLQFRLDNDQLPILMSGPPLA